MLPTESARVVLPGASLNVHRCKSEASAKRKAQQGACLSNLKQLCLANIMYVGDNGGILMQPPTASSPLRLGLH